MRFNSLLLSSAVAAALSLTGSLAVAQASDAKPAAKPATQKAAPAKSTAARKPAPKAAPAPAPLAEANEEQLIAAKQAHLGLYECEFKQTVTISPNLKHAGYIDVSYLKHQFTMKPVLSSTGALRLEDVNGRTLMVQIANKSMLLDVKAGQRMVDECIHPEQRAAMEAMRSASAPAGGGLGIAPSGH